MAAGVMPVTSKIERILVLFPVLVFLSSLTLAGPLDTEAAALRTKCLVNAAGESAGAAGEFRERARWSKVRKKLKWSRPASDPVAYLTDVNARTLTTAMASGTTYTEALPADQAEAMGTPFPAWLWRPEGLIPSNPVRVREEAGTLVLGSSLTAPSREVWLDRSTGCLLKFTETDATGRVIRTVNVSGWTKDSGVWMPRTVDDVVQGSENGLHRVIRFDRPVVNPPLADSDFRLP